jgi:pyruvate,water dikinase
MSDFKSNEYANLIGGKYFEPRGKPDDWFPGASVTTAIFIEKVCLECEAMKKVRNEMGFST